MKRHILFFIAFFAIALPICAQQPAKHKHDKKQWLNELREYKHQFITKEIELSDDQQTKFFPIYDAMQDEIFKLYSGTAKMERGIVKSKEDISDVEYEKAAEAIVEAKAKEGDIQIQYFKKFKTILSKKQLFYLQRAEKKFARNLSEQRHKHSKKNKK